MSHVYDYCSLFIFLDEGRLFHQMLRHSELYPESTPYLMNTLIPFCSLIAHDSVRFVRRHFDASFCLDSEVVTRLRNASKSLSSKGVTVNDYANDITAVIDFLSQSSKSHSGLFGNLLNSMQPDVGIAYYKGIPVCTTFNLARYLAQSAPDGIGSIYDSEISKTIGFDLGQASSVNYYTITLLNIEDSSLNPMEFSTQVKEFHFSNLKLPLRSKGINQPESLFMLYELLTQLNAIEALHVSGFFSDLLEMKFSTVTLVSLHRSIRKLTRYFIGGASNKGAARESLRPIMEIIPRREQKKIERLNGLRNALVHYDFTTLLGPEICDADAESILNLATQSAIRLTSTEYLEWLRCTRSSIVANIDSLLQVPKI